MEQSTFLGASDWRRAATLDERVRALRGPARPGVLAARDAERGSRRLEQWRAPEPFLVDGLFEQRLAQAGLTAAEVRDLLGEPDEADPPCHPQPPRSAAELEPA